MVSGDSSTPRATSAKQEENAQARVSETSSRALLPMASALRVRSPERCPASPALLPAQNFHSVHPVLSHMAGKEVGREGKTDASGL